jgi:hypothetical protein
MKRGLKRKTITTAVNADIMERKLRYPKSLKKPNVSIWL